MKAIVFNSTGDFDKVLNLTEVPIPEPAENEVRIKVQASPINPADILFINGKYRLKPVLPQIAGLEGAGIIDKLGEKVNMKIGSLVAFRDKNIWAEYVVVPANKLVVLPPDFPVEKACQFSLNPITAYALLDEANVRTEDEWILLTAGNSSVSKLIIQFAKLNNIKTIAVARNSDNFSELDSLGATAIITDDFANIEHRVNEITKGKGVKCVLDAVGGELISKLIKTISPFGKLISYGLISNENVTYHNSSIIFRNITIKGFGIDNWLNETTKNNYKDTIDVLISILINPGFIMPVAAKYPLTEYKKAFEKYIHTRNGKILLIASFDK
ncbi:MAG: zinc-dependent alcohol dehydrogenase family protein [Bacteroidales bacterium]|nr:zinc-dependent alcohol dehydrogenase family protein [Bacteroidales bacterium]MCB9012686.1 zinc-dependent alcohol dehydrogenase family protein [Bacteroidales bacterium]